jgi:hypothetical protein
MPTRTVMGASETGPKQAPDRRLQGVSHMSTFFETATRLDGSPFVRCADGAPSWVHDMVRAAHDGELPDDLRYAAIADIVAFVCEDEYEAVADPSDDDTLSDIVEAVGCDVGYSAAFAWLTPANVWRVDAFADEYGWADHGLVATVTAARCEWVREMATVVLAAFAAAYGDYVDECEREGLDPHTFHMWTVHGCPAGAL